MAEHISNKFLSAININTSKVLSNNVFSNSIAETVFSCTILRPKTEDRMQNKAMACKIVFLVNRIGVTKKAPNKKDIANRDSLCRNKK